MNTLDLYSGIGGWSLGLKMAGIETVASYDNWSRANLTHRRNLSSHVYEVDIRKLAFESLPKRIDVVVGSPPCTEFSFSNRGGTGDILEGLKDIHKFLQIVEFLRPKYWVMENVPRVAHILEDELSSTGRLKRFSRLFNTNT